jgi:hypothetical protein
MKTLSPLILCALLLAACSQAPQASIDPPPPAVYSSPTPLPQEYSTDDPILEGIRTLFSSGPHAGSYSCENCHGTSERIGKQLNWLNPTNGHTEVVSTPTELCLKCHPEQRSKSDSQSQVISPHADQDCTGCHNAHSTQASCTNSVCHTDIQTIFYAKIVRPEPHPTEGDPNSYMCGGTACHTFAKQIASAPIYHQPIHNHVPCYVCHDSIGMAVGKADDQTWFTVGQTDNGNSSSSHMVVSHSIGLEVECGKCHFVDNPWGLDVISPESQE